ncbi:hypothetical protein OVA06_19580 [Pseudarthrobacter sp. SL88]|uniref:hypothetical protein n=1 Tax=Pseudarthrobacter sp. SL88 TaxID=2994666 RepID=UPI002274936B|nr:hypothetical protein [Pseudarthrobacter sp. SL88]MCY1675774.1 hypothetical protein [Pseudarthrobacter sp. SL88]MCY1676875.1 hypothetical protein [Pseudarthrobacter sp. SL88]
MSDQPFESEVSSADPAWKAPDIELIAVARENAVTLQALLLAAQDHARKLDEALRAIKDSGVSPVAIAADAGLGEAHVSAVLAGQTTLDFLMEHSRTD